MNPEDVGRILDEIGERIGPAGEYAWQLTVRQVVIDSVVWMIAGVLLLLAGIVGAVAVERWHRWYLKQPDYRTSADVRHVWMVVFAISVPFWAPVIASNATQLLNPEYHAMVRLLERLVPQ